MKLILLFIFLFSITPDSSEEVLKKMYDQYHGKWYETFTFTQQNEFYKADTVTGTSTWYEAIAFPDKFRIDIGELADGNAAILANDSIYRFKDGKLAKQSFRKNNLTFLGGGMFFMSWENVLAEFEELGYDLSKGHKRTFNGREVYVVGADDPEEKVNQLWVDLEHLYTVRVVTFDGDTKLDGIYEGHVKVGDAWTETKVTFYMNDELYQKEYYSDYQANTALPEGLFNPSMFGKSHWMN